MTIYKLLFGKSAMQIAVPHSNHAELGSEVVRQSMAYLHPPETHSVLADESGLECIIRLDNSSVELG